MADRNSYELMVNLLNNYYLIWKRLTDILVQDVIDNAKQSSISILLFIRSFVCSGTFLFIFWKIMTLFIVDRVRPINLFLTIKKKIFEDLKNSSEAFSNKLLNKFFGNEDNEEESQQDYQANISNNDINIIKFKASNDSKVSMQQDKIFLFNFIKLVAFFLLIQAYMVFKFCFSYSNTKNIKKFS